MSSANQWPGVLAGLCCGCLLGYFYATGSSLNITRGTTSEEQASDNAREEKDSDPESDEGEAVDEDLAGVKAGMMEECKLILVVRQDLGMTKGKIAAQCGHATLACYKALNKSNPSLLRHWERTGQTKIALKADSEDELLLMQAQATSLGICARSIQDALFRGRTQIAAGSRTVLGVGPAPARLVNQITGHLRLL